MIKKITLQDMDKDAYTALIEAEPITSKSDRGVVVVRRAVFVDRVFYCQYLVNGAWGTYEPFGQVGKNCVISIQLKK